MYSEQNKSFSYGDARNYQQPRHSGYPHDYRNGPPGGNRPEARSPYGYHQSQPHHPRSPHHFNSQDYRSANASRLEPRNTYNTTSGSYRAGYAPSSGYRSQHHHQQHHQTHGSSYHSKARRNTNQSHSQRPGHPSERSKESEPRKSLAPNNKVVQCENERKNEVAIDPEHKSALPGVCASGSAAISSVEVGATLVSTFESNNGECPNETVENIANVPIEPKESDCKNHCIKTEEVIVKENEVIPSNEDIHETEIAISTTCNDVKLTVPEFVNKEIIESEELLSSQEIVERIVDSIAVSESQVTEKVQVSSERILADCDRPDEMKNGTFSVAIQEQEIHHEIVETEVENTAVCELVVTESIIPSGVLGPDDRKTEKVIQSQETDIHYDVGGITISGSEVIENIPESSEVLTKCDSNNEREIKKIVEANDDNSFGLCLEADCSDIIEIEIRPSEVGIHEEIITNNEECNPSFTEDSELPKSEEIDDNYSNSANNYTVVEPVEQPVVKELSPIVNTQPESTVEEIQSDIHNEENATTPVKKGEQTSDGACEQEIKGITTSPNKKVNELDSQKEHVDEITENLDVMYITPGKSSRKSRVLIDSTNIVESSTIKYVVREVKQKETNDITPVITPVRRSTRKKAETPGSMKSHQVIQELSPDVLRKAKIVKNPFLQT